MEGETRLLTNIRQLTFEGLRAGEGYFSADGSKLIFQSERDADNPWYQIYLMDLETGDIDRVSPGHGKTTCSWVHPDGGKALFASTHGDPASVDLQKAELEFRASGQTRRYAWDYDEHFEIYETDLKGGGYRNLTKARGYDAEGSYSPDGKLIAFSSNRHAYTEELSEEDAKIFEMDLSYMMDIYIMNADGSNVRRLTDVKGYDGGPFFSPDGRRITWRRFAPNGVTAEVYTMKLDGSDQRQLTRVGAMSWAPYYHPAGDYLIFTNNSLGFANFELFMVDVDGRRDPVRVTFTDGFDGLPVFSPDGTKLAWTTNRTANGKSQIFIADWNDEAARQLLKLGQAGFDETKLENAPDLSQNAAAIRADDMRRHIEYLASDYMQGRRTGTIGERRATEYVARAFEAMGLPPDGDDGTYFQPYEFKVTVEPAAACRFTYTIDGVKTVLALNQEWRPLAISSIGVIEASEVVFAGYGIQAPETDDFEEYDSYAHLDVEDKWVLALRYWPEDVEEKWVRHLQWHSTLWRKAMAAREHGARGLIIVTGPSVETKEELIPWRSEVSMEGSILATISVTSAVVQAWLDASGKDLKTLQDEFDKGAAAMGFTLDGVRVSADIDLVQETQTGRNVVARLYAGAERGETAIGVGAHLDHLGVGRGSGSLARDGEVSDIHHGADDNASGVAGMLEIAQYLNDLKSKGTSFKRDIVFAAWSGEELGLFGANEFIARYTDEKDDESLRPEIAAYLNMDMIGRLDEAVVVQGVGSSSIWAGEIARRNVPVGLPIKTQDDPFVPTDARAFYDHGVPILNAFTGAHEDYHRPSDTADKINYEGAEKIAKLMGLIARSLALSDDVPDFQQVDRPENMGAIGGLRVYLGTIPDYAGDVKGLRLSGVTKGAPADQAGLKQGDVIVELAGRPIENIYDYTYAIGVLKVGEETTVVIERDGERVELKITPGSRD